MHVPEELPYVPIGSAVAEEWIVVQYNSLPSHADSHLLADCLEVVHKALVDTFHIMVAEDEILAAGEGAEDVVPESGTAVRKVAQVEYDSVFRYRIPPAADELSVHLLNIIEWPITESDDVLVPEVSIRGKPNQIWREGGDSRGHSICFFCKVRKPVGVCQIFANIAEICTGISRPVTLRKTIDV